MFPRSINEMVVYVRMIEKIISGGQTGVDRAALDVALEFDVPCGGWCPKGRKAEDGPIALQYPLVEVSSEAYAQRTEWNVRDSDGTLVLNKDELIGGTADTIVFARRYRKPCFIIDLERPPDFPVVREWVQREAIRVLNIAGPRESKRPGIYQESVCWLRKLLSSEGSDPNRET